MSAMSACFVKLTHCDYSSWQFTDMFDITKNLLLTTNFISIIPFCISLLAINSKDYVKYILSTLRLLYSTKFDFGKLTSHPKHTG